MTATTTQLVGLQVKLLDAEDPRAFFDRYIAEFNRAQNRMRGPGGGAGHPAATSSAASNAAQAPGSGTRSRAARDLSPEEQARREADGAIKEYNRQMREKVRAARDSAREMERIEREQSRVRRELERQEARERQQSARAARQDALAEQRQMRQAQVSATSAARAAAGRLGGLFDEDARQSARAAAKANSEQRRMTMISARHMTPDQLRQSGILEGDDRADSILLRAEHRFGRQSLAARRRRMREDMSDWSAGYGSMLGGAHAMTRGIGMAYLSAHADDQNPGAMVQGLLGLEAGAGILSGGAAMAGGLYRVWQSKEINARRATRLASRFMSGVTALGGGALVSTAGEYAATSIGAAGGTLALGGGIAAGLGMTAWQLGAGARSAWNGTGFWNGMASTVAARAVGDIYNMAGVGAWFNSSVKDVSGDKIRDAADHRRDVFQVQSSLNSAQIAKVGAAFGNLTQAQVALAGMGETHADRMGRLQSVRSEAHAQYLALDKSTASMGSTDANRDARRESLGALERELAITQQIRQERAEDFANRIAKSQQVLALAENEIAQHKQNRENLIDQRAGLASTFGSMNFMDQRSLNEAANRASQGDQLSDEQVKLLEGQGLFQDVTRKYRDQQLREKGSPALTAALDKKIAYETEQGEAWIDVRDNETGNIHTQTRQFQDADKTDKDDMEKMATDRVATLRNDLHDSLSAAMQMVGEKLKEQIVAQLPSIVEELAKRQASKQDQARGGSAR